MIFKTDMTFVQKKKMRNGGWRFSIFLTMEYCRKQSYNEDDLILVFKNSRINETHSQGYYFQAKNGIGQ